jgi:hypothetical protein
MSPARDLRRWLPAGGTELSRSSLKVLSGDTSGTNHGNALRFITLSSFRRCFNKETPGNANYQIEYQGK